MKFFSILLMLLLSVFITEKSVSGNVNSAKYELIETYYFKINSKLFKRNNVIKVTFFSPINSTYETSYIYESYDGLEKIYHDYNEYTSVVQRLYYKFPTVSELNQFLVTGDMKFNSYLHVDLDVDFLDTPNNEGFSIIDGKISLGINGKDIIDNDFDLELKKVYEVNLEIPYLISKN